MKAELSHTTSSNTSSQLRKLIILFGAPGSGKGTQASYITQKFQFTHISTGDLLRQEIQDQSVIGIEALRYIKQGQLAPTKLILDILYQKLSRCDSNAILDGFPRNVEQAKIFQRMVEHLYTPVAIFLHINDEEVISRIISRRLCPQCKVIYNIVSCPTQQENICDACGTQLSKRPDDSETTIRERLKVFHEQTMPVIDFYKQHGNLYAVDASLPSHQVYDACCSIIEQHA